MSSRYDRYDDRDRGRDRDYPRYDDRDRGYDRRDRDRDRDRGRDYGRDAPRRGDDYGRGRDRDRDRDRDYPPRGGRDDRGYGRGRDFGRGRRDDGRVPDDKNCRVHIGNLSKKASYDDIRARFGKYGRILNIDIKEGYGFVEFDNPRSAGDAVFGLKDETFDGAPMKISFAMGKKPQFASKGRGDFAIRVENLDRKTSWQDLKDFARQAGEVAYTDVREQNGETYGIIEYLNEADFDRAMKQLDGSTLDGRKVKFVPEATRGSGSGSGSGNGGDKRSRTPEPARSRERDRSYERGSDAKKEDDDDYYSGSKNSGDHDDY